MSDEKKHIQHGTVQETLLIPLYARKKCVEKYPDLFHDEDAVRLFDRIDYVMENEPQEFSYLAGGIRQYNFVCEINEYLKDHPRACIVNLGCGLDTTFYQVDNGQTKGYNVDFPDVIAIRNELLPPKERETNRVGDLTDKSWYEKIDFKEEDGAVFIAGGVFCYLTYDNVKALLCNLANHFHGGMIAFDVVSPFGLQLVKKVVLATAQMQEVDAFFAVKHPERELKKWSDSFASVEAKKYFRGYMKPDKRWDVLTRFVCRIEDNFKICQFVIVHFKYRSLLFTRTLSQQTFHIFFQIRLRLFFFLFDEYFFYSSGETSTPYVFASSSASIRHHHASLSSSPSSSSPPPAQHGRRKSGISSRAACAARSSDTPHGTRASTSHTPATPGCSRAPCRCSSSDVDSGTCTGAADCTPCTVRASGCRRCDRSTNSGAACT